MKHDLSGRLSNKRRQLFWDWPRYGRQVASFFRWWAFGRRQAATFVRTVRPASDTLMVFALPVAAALAALMALALVFMGAMWAVSMATAGALAVWVAVIDIAHAPAILALRAAEVFRRRFQRKNIFVCPYCHSDLWQGRHHVPGFLCEHGKRHYFVRPSTFGLLSHVAECGCRIGTLHGRDGGARSEMQMFCPKCADPRYTRAISVEGFGKLPHVSVGVIGPPEDDGPGRFIRDAWEGLERAGRNGARLKVRYADRGSLPEFEDLVGGSFHDASQPRPPGRRKLGTWIWRVEGARGQSLLYLHQSDMSWHGAGGDDVHQREKAFEGISGILLVTRAGEDATETEAIVSAARIKLAGRFAGFKGKLPVPVAVIVMGGEPPFRKSVDEHVQRLVESNFTPVKYCGSGPEQGAGAMEFMLSHCRGAKVV